MKIRYGSSAPERSGWGLSDSSGRAALRVSPSAELPVGDHEHGVTSDIQLRSRLPTSEAHDVEVVVRHFCIKGDRLAALHRDLQTWLELPMSAWHDLPFTARHELCTSAGQSLVLDFQPRQDIILPRGCTACALALEHNRFQSSLLLAADPTVLGALERELQRALGLTSE